MTSRNEFVSGPDGCACCPPESRCTVAGGSGSCRSRAGAPASARFAPLPGVSGDSRLLPSLPMFRVDSAIVSGWTSNPDCSGSGPSFNSAEGSMAEETAGMSAASSARRVLSSSSTPDSGSAVNGVSASRKIPSVSRRAAPCQTASHASRPVVFCSSSPVPLAAGACPSSSNRAAASGVVASIGNGVTRHQSAGAVPFAQAAFLQYDPGSPRFCALVRVQQWNTLEAVVCSILVLGRREDPEIPRLPRLAS